MINVTNDVIYVINNVSIEKKKNQTLTSAYLATYYIVFIKKKLWYTFFIQLGNILGWLFS